MRPERANLMRRLLSALAFWARRLPCRLPTTSQAHLRHHARGLHSRPFLAVQAREHQRHGLSAAELLVVTAIATKMMIVRTA